MGVRKHGGFGTEARAPEERERGQSEAAAAASGACEALSQGCGSVSGSVSERGACASSRAGMPPGGQGGLLLPADAGVWSRGAQQIGAV